MGSTKKETKKEKWQRIAKKQKIKFQKNDTIPMLVSATAPTLGVDPTKGNAKQLEEKVEKAFNKANAPKKAVKPVVKDAPKKAAKPVVKDAPKKAVKPVVKDAPKKAAKPVVITPPDGLSNENIKIKIPSFNNPAEMKNFCVTYGLNKVDGYIPVSKLKKAAFKKWIEENIDKAKIPSTPKIEGNPHSPSAGIGEMESNVGGAINKVGVGTSEEKITKPVVKATPEVSPKMDIPDMKPSDNSNEPPTALSENQKPFVPDFGGVEEVKQSNTEMESYRSTIISAINSTHFILRGGNMPRENFDILVQKQLDPRFNYEPKYIEEGIYIEMSDHNENSLRVPEEGYLRVD